MHCAIYCRSLRVLNTAANAQTSVIVVQLLFLVFNKRQSITQYFLPRRGLICKTWSFHVVVWQRTATKCTKIYRTCTAFVLLIKPFFCCRCRRGLLISSLSAVTATIGSICKFFRTFIFDFELNDHHVHRCENVVLALTKLHLKSDAWL